MNSEEKAIQTVIDMFVKHLKPIYNDCREIYDKVGRDAVPGIQFVIDTIEGSILVQRSWLNKIKWIIK